MMKQKKRRSEEEKRGGSVQRGKGVAFIVIDRCLWYMVFTASEAQCSHVLE